MVTVQKEKQMVRDQYNHCRTWDGGSPKLWKIATTGLGGCLASRAPVSMSKALCATASTKENHEIKMKTEIPRDPIILLLGRSTKW